MVLSHRHKFIFLKTKKTAGTSIEISLARFCGPSDIITPDDSEALQLMKEAGVKPQNYLKPIQQYNWEEWKGLLNTFPNLTRSRKMYYNHIPAAEICNAIGSDIYDGYFKFCFERNPWDKAVSAYYFELSRSGISEHSRSFKDFIRTNTYYRNFHRYTINGEMAVDLVVDFSNLKQGLSDAMNKVGIDFDGWIPRAKTGTRKATAHYSTFYDDSDIAWVADQCKEEIELMGYVFDDQRHILV